MTPSARLQAAIDLLDEIILAARDNGASADIITKKYFKTRRYAGSKDRRAIREFVYSCIRRFGERPESGRSAMVGLAAEMTELNDLFDDSAYGPKTLGPNEPASSGGLIPCWLEPYFSKLVDNVEKIALFDRAPLDIRMNMSLAAKNEVQKEWPEAEQLPFHEAFRLPSGKNIEQSDLHRSGAVEIQDLGSQTIVKSCPIQNTKIVLDMCAGAGGKTLALVDQLPKSTRIIAADTDLRRLGRLKPRAQRAGASNIETLLLNPNQEMEALKPFIGLCDVVLVDAPCSGTGTWRRNPELRWRMTPKRLEQTVNLQARLLAMASKLVAPGGRLIYAVCSLLDAEGAEQTESFLKNHSDWQYIEIDLPLGRQYRKGTILTPHHDGTDGFYFTALEKK